MSQSTEDSKPKRFLGFAVNDSRTQNAIRTVVFVLLLIAVLYSYTNYEIDVSKEEAEYPFEAVAQGSTLNKIINELDEPYKKRYITSLNQTFASNEVNTKHYITRIGSAIITAGLTDYIVNGNVSKEGMLSKTFIYAIVNTYLSVIL